ncbi:hypothetical protein JG688_00014863 [Phytophthora aleatoria]|uniref:Uncharacterized protein n=1 Tax=Phytophthora aleatoria TaxID=2496075 RepID=A0A8J5IGL1_9STRA|nr:hypothetical protein JG688_00014863 [Phytophthora aleatoria]
MDKMKLALMVSSKTKLPGDLVAQYRAPAFVVDLEEVMVSPRGIYSYTNDMNSPRVWFSVCNECNISIVQYRVP